MRDRETAIENGLLIPDEETCKACHNENSPTFQGFDFEEDWKKIEHHTPEVSEVTAERKASQNIQDSLKRRQCRYLIPCNMKHPVQISSKGMLFYNLR